jgi:hypothetical protein
LNWRRAPLGACGRLGPAVLALLLVVVGTTHSAPASEPTSSAAHTRAAVLALLRQPGPLIIGQHIGHAPAAAAGYAAGFSGPRVPRLCGVDYAWGAADKAAIARANALLIAHARRGGLVTVSMHPGNPATASGDPRDTTAALTAVLTPDTVAHQRWRAELAIIADGLAELRAAGVPVLWRPLHEANGPWFWWGGGDAAEYRRLWADLHSYLTHERGLDHLIWVYSPNARLSPEIADPLDRLPPLTQVDAVALDVYADHFDAETLDAAAAQRLAATGLPLGFGELGPLHRRGELDARTVLTALHTHAPQARWCLWWHSWTGRGLFARRQRLALADNPGAAEVLALPSVDSLPGP